MKLTHTAIARHSLTLCLILTGSLAFAQQPAPATAAVAPTAPGVEPQDHSTVGAATHTWLTMQSSNVAAAPARPGGGEEASLVYHRYLDSFKHAIPAFFASSTGKGSGASGGGSN